MKTKGRYSRYTEDVWWLALAFCLCFGFSGTYGAMHQAVADSKRFEKLSESEITIYTEEEDAKEQKVFIIHGVIGGTAGFVLCFLTLRLLRRKRKEKPETSETPEVPETS